MEIAESAILKTGSKNVFRTIDVFSKNSVNNKTNKLFCAVMCPSTQAVAYVLSNSLKGN